jgi:Leucine-rich repeat (LRR) protein
LISAYHICKYCNKSIIELNSHLSDLHNQCVPLYESDLQEERISLSKLGAILNDDFSILTKVPDDSIDPLPANYVIVDKFSGFVIKIIIDGVGFTELEDYDFIPDRELISPLLLNFKKLEYILFQFMGDLGIISTDFSSLTFLRSIHFNYTSVNFSNNFKLPSSLKCFNINYENELSFPCHLITKLPNSLEDLTIKCRSLNHIPHYIGKLTNLKSLQIHGTVKFIPDELFLLSNLKKLDLSCNNISDLPVFWDKLIHLESLNLSRNKISSAVNLNLLTNIIELDLSNNQIIDISVLNDSNSLQYLFVSNNLIDNLDNLEKLVNLDTFEIQSNNITIIPESLINLPKLRVFHVSGKPISKINDLKNSHLASLSLEIDSQSSVLESITKLQTLKKLKITNSIPFTIPESFLQLENLETLIFCFGKDNIPQFLKNLPKINEILSITYYSDGRAKIEVFYRASGYKSP